MYLFCELVCYFFNRRELVRNEAELGFCRTKHKVELRRPLGSWLDQPFCEGLKEAVLQKWLRLTVTQEGLLKGALWGDIIPFFYLVFFTHKKILARIHTEKPVNPIRLGFRIPANAARQWTGNLRAIDIRVYMPLLFF